VNCITCLQDATKEGSKQKGEKGIERRWGEKAGNLDIRVNMRGGAGRRKGQGQGNDQQEIKPRVPAVSMQAALKSLRL